jgi:predicted restriction endonuclease
MILARYENKCCMTGITSPQLLVASHIVPWAASTEHRMNPRNGLSLNALHDRAFDRGLITVTDDFKVRVGTRIREAKPWVDAGLLVASENQPLRLHGGFSPDPELLVYHRENIFEG